MNVVPALLEQDVEVQKGQLMSLSRFYSRFQIDIADNTFVPNKTTQVDELNDSSFFNMAGGAIFDFHLMVSDPMKHITAIRRLPKKRVGCTLIHHSVFPLYEDLKRLCPAMRFGLVLNPEDEVSSVPEELLTKLPSLQVMTITPGFQGSSFIEELLIKIEQLRKRGYRGEILIDGSVNEKTLPIILAKEYRPDILGIGSFLTKASPKLMKERVQYLNTILS